MSNAAPGVALGRIPPIERFLADRRLVAPFAKRNDSPRSYFAIAAPHAAQRPAAEAFVAWLREETQAPPVAPAAASAPRKSRTPGTRHAA